MKVEIERSALLDVLIKILREDLRAAKRGEIFFYDKDTKKKTEESLAWLYKWYCEET